MTKTVRATPMLGTGHPTESLAVLATVLGHVGPDARYAFETQYQHLTGDQIRTITDKLARLPLSANPNLVFQRALTELTAPAPAV